MGLPAAAEGLDDRDALDELDGGGADAPHGLPHPASLPLPVLALQQALQSEAEEHRHERDERQPPVHPGEVPERGEGDDDGGGGLDGRMGDEVVQLVDVALHHAVDLSGAAVRVPAERYLAEALGEQPPQ